MLRFTAVAVFLVASIAATTPAIAGDCYSACLVGERDWSGRTNIPVWVNRWLDENLVHYNTGLAWTEAEVKNEIENVLETLNENLPTGAPPFVYKGPTSVAWDAFIAGAVHITPCLRLICGGEGDTACPTGVVNGSVLNGIRLMIKRSQAGVGGPPGGEDCNFRWEHYKVGSSLPATGLTLRGTLNHELGHVLGLGHYNVGPDCGPCNCTTPPCACMQSNDGETNLVVNCMMWDYDILRLHRYGVLDWTKRNHLESNDGTSWYELSGIPNAGPFYAFSSSTDMGQMGYVRKERYTQKPDVYQWDWASLAWSFWGQISIVSARSLGLIGVSLDPSPFRIRVGQTSGETATDSLKEIMVTTFSNPSVWSSLIYGSNLSFMQGVGMAHDPRQDLEVLAWRDNNAQVQITLYFPTGTFLGSFPINGAYSTDAPSVTCGNASLAINCVLTWSDSAKDPGVQYHTLRWQHFAVNYNARTGWFLSYGSQMSSGYVMFGSPTVTYKGPISSTCAYVFAWKNPGPLYYTVCKGSGTSAGLTAGTEVGHSVSGRAFSPAIGASNGYGELIDGWK